MHDHLEICGILEETILMRKLKLHGLKIKRSRKAVQNKKKRKKKRKAAQGLVRRTRTGHWFVTLVFL